MATLDESARARGVRRVLLATLALNLVVATAKVVYGIWAGSLSIRADGFHSATDGLNNVVLLVGSWLGSRPPDREHPYGHKKIEVLTAMVIAAGLLLVAWDVVRDVILHLAGKGAPPHIEDEAYVVLGVTLVVNVLVAVWEARAGRRLMSPGLVSDAAHTRSDVLVTLGVMATAVLTQAGFAWADVVAGAGVAVVIGVTAVGIVKRNAGYLVDTSLVDVTQVAAAARSIEGVRAVRDIRSRGTPGGVFVDLAIAVDGAARVDEAHAVAHRVEDAIRREQPGVIGVQVHVEPAAP